jgi:GxxExxY protein
MASDQVASPGNGGVPGLIEKELTGRVIGTFFDVYNALGFGFLESIYARAMEQALVNAGMRVEREYPASVYFRGEAIGFHRVDMLIERRLVVEIKATDVLPPTSRRQLRNYLCALRLDGGLILHFGPKPEFQRMIGRR